MLRSLHEFLQPRGQHQDDLLQAWRFGVAQTHLETTLTGVLGLAGRTGEQPGAGAHRFGVLAGAKEPVVERPPVVDQGTEAGGVLAGGECLGGESRPGPTGFSVRRRDYPRLHVLDTGWPG